MISGAEPIPSPCSSRQTPADAALVSALVAMRRSPGRFCPVFLKLVEAELRARRWSAGSWEEPLGKPLVEKLLEIADPVVPTVPTASGPPAPTAEQGPQETTSEKHHGVEMSSKHPQHPTRPALRRPSRRPMTGEERGSLAAWSTLLAMVVIAFFTWSPSRPGRRGGEGLARVVLPAPDDAAGLPLGALVRRPLSEILEIADSSDPAARGRMIAALVRRGAARELAGLLVHPTAGVRGAIPQALSSLGLVGSDQVGDYAARLLSPLASVRDQAVRELASQVGRQTEEIARGR